jgi:hypothetical protein
MGEVATVAAIVGGIATSGITGLVTWKVSRNSTSVELVKVAAENHRLRYGNQEDERRNRQSTYHQYLNALIKIFQLMGTGASKDEVARNRNEYMYLHAGVVLFAPPSVRNAAREVAEAYNEISPALDVQREEHLDKSESDRWRDATAGLKEALGEKIGGVTAAMHADVTRGIAEDPEY